MFFLAMGYCSTSFPWNRGRGQSGKSNVSLFILLLALLFPSPSPSFRGDGGVRKSRQVEKTSPKKKVLPILLLFIYYSLVYFLLIKSYETFFGQTCKHSPMRNGYHSWATPRNSFGEGNERSSSTWSHTLGQATWHYSDLYQYSSKSHWHGQHHQRIFASPFVVFCFAQRTRGLSGCLNAHWWNWLASIRGRATCYSQTPVRGEFFRGRSQSQGVCWWSCFFSRSCACRVS